MALLFLFLFLDQWFWASLIRSDFVVRTTFVWGKKKTPAIAAEQVESTAADVSHLQAATSTSTADQSLLTWRSLFSPRKLAPALRGRILNLNRKPQIDWVMFFSRKATRLVTSDMRANQGPYAVKCLKFRSSAQFRHTNFCLSRGSFKADQVSFSTLQGKLRQKMSPKKMRPLIGYRSDCTQ